MTDQMTDRVTVLFREYLWAEDEARDFDVGALLASAGPDRDELWRRIRTHRSLRSIAREIGREEEPESLGRFELVQKLGEGGVGRVYLAYDPELRRRVALKVLEMRQADDRERSYVVHEARSLARLEHPGVVRVHEVGEASARAYIVMENIQGPALFDVIAALRRERDGVPAVDPNDELADPVEHVAAAFRSYKVRVRCLIGLAEALAYVHDAGVLHRDVKPSNILFEDAESPKLIDFGLAHLPDGGSQVGITQTLVGTPAYISPEQIESERTGADPRSDIFSFGVLAYELLSLVQPFQRESRSRTLNAIVRSRPEPLRRRAPAVSLDLARVVHHCLEREPSDRYSSFDQVVADLRAVQEQRSISLGDATFVSEALLWIRRNRRQVLVVCGAAILGLCFLIGQSLASGFRERAEIVQSVSGVVDQMGDHRSPEDFRRSHAVLSRAQWDTVRYDASWLRARVVGSPRKEVLGATELWSRRLGDVVAEELAHSKERGTAFQQIAWRAIIELDRELCPQGEWNQALRDAGRVVIEPVTRVPSIQMFALCQLPSAERGYVSFREVAPVEYPVPGFYRYTGRRADGSIAWECEHLCGSTWQPPVWIRPRERGELFSSARTFSGGTVDVCVPLGAGGFEVQGELEVEGFRASKLITRKEFERYTGGSPKGALLEGPADDHTACLVSWQEAVSFCRLVGGRLITARELQLIARSSGIEALVAEQYVSGEWVSNQVTDPSRAHYMAASYSWMEGTDGEMPIRWLAESWDGTRVLLMDSSPDGQQLSVREQLGVGFRVAFSEQ